MAPQLRGGNRASDELARKILDYFTDSPKGSFKISHTLGTPRDETHALLYSFITLGLIERVRGMSSGTVYRITERGRAYREHFLEAR